MTTLPTHQAGCRMPSLKSISLADENVRTQAETANERFLERLRAYFENGGRG